MPFQLQIMMNDIMRYGNRSENTIKAYGTYTTAFLEDCILRGIDPLQIYPEEITDFLNRLQLTRGLKDVTINHATSEIKYLLLCNGYQYWDPIKTPFKKVPHMMPYVPTKDEIVNLINSISDEHLKEKTMITIIYSSGMRHDECCHLKCKDIWFSKKQIFIQKGKGGKSRWVTLDPQAYELILKYWHSLSVRPGTNDWLFSQQKHFEKPIYEEFLTSFLKKFCSDNGLPHITPRNSRHAYATHSIMGGMDIHILQALMGHESVETTMIYVYYADVFRALEVKSPLSTVRIKI